MANPTDPMVTPGWNNQVSTGTVQTQTGASTNLFTNDPGGAVPFLARTMDTDDVTGTGITPVANTGYFGLVWIPGGVSTKKATWMVITTGASTHGYVTLMTPAGVPVLQTADLTSAFGASGVANSAFWNGASASVGLSVASGFYYLGLGFAGTAPVFGGSTPQAVLSAAQNPTAYSATPPFARWITGIPNGAAYTGTAPTSFGTLTLQTSLGALYVGMF